MPHTFTCSRLKRSKSEADAVRDVAKAVYRLKIVLDRVVLISTGVLGCWQIMASSLNGLTIEGLNSEAIMESPARSESMFHMSNDWGVSTLVDESEPTLQENAIFERACTALV